MRPADRDRTARTADLALAALAVLLVSIPLGLAKPGLPTVLKADEPAYYLMARSLAEDGDLRCETRDLERLFEEFPYRAAENLILMTDDGWHTVYFGKPYAYSLFAAPAAALFRGNGIVAFNLLLLMAMVWMGKAYLARFNGHALAAIYSASFFLVSLGLAYAFWIHPEIFMMTSVTACLFLAFHEPEGRPALAGRWRALWRRLAGPSTWPFWSGAALALGTYHKPMLIAMGLPAVAAFQRRRGWRTVPLWIVGFGLVAAALSGGGVAMTGHPSAYLGVERTGTKVSDPTVMPIQPREEAIEEETKNSWTWLLRIPEVKPRQLADNVESFLVGRHTGLVPYLPFAVLSALFFLLHGRRSGTRWLLLAATGSVALYFLLWIPFNWHGGGGFVGNRYFVNVYPAFLFLVTAVRPAPLVLLGQLAGGLYLGALLLTPWGAPVVHPTLQAHVRGPAFDVLPGETAVMRRIPGYDGISQSGAWFRARKDVVDQRGSQMWIQAGPEVELWMITAQPTGSALFEVRTEAPDNVIRIRTPGDEATVVFEDARRRTDKAQMVQLETGEPRYIHPVEGRPGYLYRIHVQASRGRSPRRADGSWVEPRFHLGAALTYLGSIERLRDPRFYEVEWLECSAPERVTAGGEFEVRTRVVNRTPDPWPPYPLPTQVALGYHWYTESGTLVTWDGRRTAMREPLAPGAELAATQHVLAPGTPGTYRLAVDLARETIAWFSERNGGSTCDAVVRVEAAEPE